MAINRRYYQTVFEYRPCTWVQFTINRLGETYDLKCHIAGAGTDTIIIGTLGDCYRKLKKQTKGAQKQ